MPRIVSWLLPNWKSLALAVLSAVLLILSFPDFEIWFLAWFALVPLMWAVEREKACVRKCVMLGWAFGTVFFFGTCWWLTYAPIHYAAFPAWLAYALMLVVAIGVGIFPALFAGILAVMLRRFGSWGFLAAPFVWVLTEFLRYWVTGNNWNAIGYSQASVFLRNLAAIGGIMLVGFATLSLSSLVMLAARRSVISAVTTASLTGVLFILALFLTNPLSPCPTGKCESATFVAVQPNVPMSYIDSARLDTLRQGQIELAESSLNSPTAAARQTAKIVILPESPMNYMYTDDREFQQYIGDFARRNNVSVLFNSAEPDSTNGKYFNSAVMVGADGRKVDEYDKIFLLPFGEAVPPPLEGILPGFVGNFSYGSEYDLLPVGDAKAGVMICFESHFGQLSRRYVADGADVLIEMTNDGYLGPTPVLRQHLANAVFRAVETNRPVLRVTNVGVTAYITETGQVIDPAPTYTEATRVWSVSKSDGSQTFYVRYGDWFAWLCTIISIGLLGYGVFRPRQQPV